MPVVTSTVARARRSETRGCGGVQEYYCIRTSSGIMHGKIEECPIMISTSEQVSGRREKLALLARGCDVGVAVVRGEGWRGRELEWWRGFCDPVCKRWHSCRRRYLKPDALVWSSRWCPPVLVPRPRSSMASSASAASTSTSSSPSSFSSAGRGRWRWRWALGGGRW